MASLNPTQIVAGIQVLSASFEHGVIQWRTDEDPVWRILAGDRACDGRTLAEALEKMLAASGRENNTETRETASGAEQC